MQEKVRLKALNSWIGIQQNFELNFWSLVQKFIIHFVLIAKLAPVWLTKQHLFQWRKTAVLRENLNIILTVESSSSTILKEYLSYSEENYPECRRLQFWAYCQSCLRSNFKENLQGLWSAKTRAINSPRGHSQTLPSKKAFSPHGWSYRHEKTVMALLQMAFYSLWHVWLAQL